VRGRCAPGATQRCQSRGDESSNSKVKGLVALTIDDGLCRRSDDDDDNDGDGDGGSNSMVPEVLALFKKHDAHVTFFACTDYTTIEEARLVLRDGHEIGNHLQKDAIGYYHTLSKEDFRKELVGANAILDRARENGSDGDNENGEGDNDEGDNDAKRTRWFRAPQGRMNKRMAEVVKEEGMTHVLGDCYCDDWAFGQADDDQTASTAATAAGGVGGDNGSNNGSNSSSTGNKNKQQHKKMVVELVLKQVERYGGGSIIGLHMPQRGFRESLLEAIEEILEGLQQRNFRVVSLTELEQAASR